ncbi:hypothetical protein AMK21_03645 [Streptomyces sp. CB00316]|uniref:DUF305 domain-containing protein n=1 Tax=unclassified Streptomyces TaxID=2593676 RepID=UPI00093AFA1E|nr:MULTISPECIES: DUF305 domain-containing protein [unclassified Streptomyces]MBT2380168.1 DUF305 domain-containing protein [Streptomyces sp. ISL-111]MBT2429490.1 DUF305 domain-containing protein [Streptomyces sp. ISL-112]MBT2463405.1 DUF305 domain-containing protein [Streptomyces sp. ISL-63]OKJ24168.1 hypothetical protein AMK21_03645 [Streptomyces sp. CB00316]
MAAGGTGGDAGSDGRSGTRRVRWVAGGAVVLALVFAGAATFASARGGGGNGVPAVDSADAGFARDMAVHHQQAVEMSFIVRDRTDDEDVRRLAYDIANTQANQRGMLLGWLDLWELPKVAPDGERPMAWMEGGGGHGDHAAGVGAGSGVGLMPGMATKDELRRLGTRRGAEAEVLFLQLMTDHHKGGVSMAEACASLCSVPVEKRLARGMVEGQRSELGLMRDLLAARGAKPRT